MKKLLFLKYARTFFSCTVSRLVGVIFFTLLSLSLASLPNVAFAADWNDPTVKIWAEPGLVEAGDTTTIVWSSDDARYCEGAGGIKGTKDTSGSERVTVAKTTTYTIACHGRKASARASVVVEIVSPTSSIAAPTLEFWADRSLIGRTESFQLLWRAQRVDTCASDSRFFNMDGSPDPSTASDSDLWNNKNLPVAGSITINPARTGEYTLTCAKSGTSVRSTVRIPVVNGPVVKTERTPHVRITLAASKTVVAYGEPVTLSWYAPDTTRCYASGRNSGTGSDTPQPAADWFGNRAHQGSGVVTAHQTTAYALECWNGANASTRAELVVVAKKRLDDGQSPTLTFSPTSLSLNEGATGMFSWRADNASSCTVVSTDVDFFGFQPLIGSATVHPKKTTEYKLICWNEKGASVERVMPVTVMETPEVGLEFAASESVVHTGQPFMLLWKAAHATTCTASNGWSGQRGASGNESVAISRPTLFALQCFNGAGKSVSRTIDVMLDDQTDPSRLPTLDFTIDKKRIVRTNEVLLSWSAQHTEQCQSGNIALSSDGAEMWGETDEWHALSREPVGALFFKPKNSMKYFLSCVGKGMKLKKTVKVTVVEAGEALAPLPTDSVSVALTADATVVPRGGSTTIRWATKNATWCRATGDWDGVKQPGTHAFEVTLARNMKFGLECFNDEGFAALHEISILAVDTTRTAAHPPRIRLNLETPLPIQTGMPFKLSWDAQGAVACSASGSHLWFGFKPPTGSLVLLADVDAAYTLHCWTHDGFSGEPDTVRLTNAPPQTETRRLSPLAAIVHNILPIKITRLFDQKKPASSLGYLKTRAKKISKTHLNTAPVAAYELEAGEDTDHDGLANAVEEEIGTNPQDPDTDGDGYGDREELVNRYNPRGAGRGAAASSTPKELRGRLVMVVGAPHVWYISSTDGKRYRIVSLKARTHLKRQLGSAARSL